MCKKFFSVTMASLLAATLLCGCGGGNQKNKSEQHLKIYALEQGYGSDWCKETIAAFKQEDWVKEKYPKLEIEVVFNDISSFSLDQMNLGSKYNDYDILFGSKLESFAGRDDVVLDLTDSVYNAKVPGEEVTYKEKLNKDYGSFYAYNDPVSGKEKYYSAPWMTGIAGFIYNEDALANYKLEVPRTTDEFYNALVTIREANKSKYGVDPSAQYGIIQSKEAPYWQMYNGGALTPWWGQYEGVEGYNDFFNGIVGGERSIEIFKQQGRLESLKVMEKLLDYKNGFLSPASFNTEFMVAQTSFLQGSAVFHFNGDYFIDEMKEVKEMLIDRGIKVPVIKMMKTPIISSITKKCTTIENDEELSALVKAIDEGSTALKGNGYDVNQKDFDKIFKARRIVNAALTSSCVIPAYSKSKNLAVDFLRFMATDAGIKAYCKGASGSSIAFDFDLEKDAPELYRTLEPFQQERISYMCNNDDPVYVLRPFESYPLCSYGGVSPFVNMKYYTELSSQGKTTTAQKLYDETIEYWTSGLWSTALTKAGLN